ncbi:MAG: hypothetical protein ACI94Y_002440 [Maribacter sp.]|jgi:hypothetical protein
MNVGIWLIIDSDDKENLGVITVGNGSDPNLTIDIFKALIADHGRFIYYDAGGLMSLITIEKSNEQILNEKGGYD